MIVGVDEVGRGCLAGPVCVAAVALDVRIKGLNDSKKILKPKREELALIIKQKAVKVGIGWAPHSYIDQFGLTAALKAAALQALLPFYDDTTEILLDGNHNYIGDLRVRTIIGGDGLRAEISAASIVAKVARDNYMAYQAKKYPVYGFERHVGYSTPGHKLMLSQEGPCAIHRMSFLPLKNFANVN